MDGSDYIERHCVTPEFLQRRADGLKMKRPGYSGAIVIELV
jgi:hypothetical protein